MKLVFAIKFLGEGLFDPGRTGGLTIDIIPLKHTGYDYYVLEKFFSHLQIRMNKLSSWKSIKIERIG